MKTKTDTSYGIIPLRKDTSGNWEVFLIHQFSGRVGNAYWTLPKGHPEGKETPIETAKRELYEETGLQVERFLCEQPFSNEYEFRVDDVLIQKTAVYYLATVSGQQVLQEAEVHNAAWVPIDKVIARLDFDTNKKMFKQVVEHLSPTEVIRD